MKKILLTLPLCTFTFCLALVPLNHAQANENLAISDVTSEVNIQAFATGESSEAGSFMYIVDRTSGLCFASMRIARAMGSGLGLTQIDCKRLTRIPSIAMFIKSGRTR